MSLSLLPLQLSQPRHLNPLPWFHNHEQHRRYMFYPSNKFDVSTPDFFLTSKWKNNTNYAYVKQMYEDWDDYVNRAISDSSPREQEKMTTATNRQLLLCPCFALMRFKIARMDNFCGLTSLHVLNTFPLKNDYFDTGICRETERDNALFLFSVGLITPQVTWLLRLVTPASVQFKKAHEFKTKKKLSKDRIKRHLSNTPVVDLHRRYETELSEHIQHTLASPTSSLPKNETFKLLSLANKLQFAQQHNSKWKLDDIWYLKYRKNVDSANKRTFAECWASVFQNTFEWKRDSVNNSTISQKCNKCQHVDVITTYEQRRSGDEVMTQIKKCLKCNRYL
ncbi:hypothetical protein GE061_016759 [Apolygus lucorum]|uniref:TFIIS-type domain-containing protein n=1 Tax=Apolygus lucorum TaxID=248454 RepID=A0A8S9XL43_APOLU|nr:hypothetical protein GE061_016759 [Apolygus lucorum]